VWNGIRGQPKFQSHAGSIEATWSDTCGGKTSSFQSHAGSIEALPPYAWVGSGGFGFNPTLVRLRPGGLIWLLVISLPVSIPRWFD